MCGRLSADDTMTRSRDWRPILVCRCERNEVGLFRNDMLVSIAQLLARSAEAGEPAVAVWSLSMVFLVCLMAECLLGQHGKVVQNSRCLSVIQVVMCVEVKALEGCECRSRCPGTAIANSDCRLQARRRDSVLRILHRSSLRHAYPMPNSYRSSTCNSHIPSYDMMHHTAPRSKLQTLTAVICKQPAPRLLRNQHLDVPALVEVMAEQHVPPLCSSFCRLTFTQPRISCRLLCPLSVARLLAAVLVLDGLVVEVRELR
jgi:hypothetical protein